MDDREQMEMVAKAAGIYMMGVDCFWVHSDSGGLIIASNHPEFTEPRQMGVRSSVVCGNCGWGWVWNPRYDDGDALRLAVKLNIRVRYHDVLKQALAQAIKGDEVEINLEDCGGDQNEATRRAIFKVAVEIGKSM